jgi:SPP1 family predicted phage head-tail adaptor
VVAGKLRHTIKIQAKTLTTDSYGGPVETWADVASVPASAEPLQGRELAAAQTVNAETTTRFHIRYRSGVIPANRIVFESKYYNITSVIDPDLRHRELVIMASEGLNEG